MKRSILTAAASALIFLTLQSQALKSPGEFLGYEPGTQFTWHHKAVEYFKYVAENSPLVEYREYGMSYEGRPLGVCFVSSEENLANLEELRKNNLIKTGLLKGDFTGKQIPFIWLAYNVHGNEAVGMEAAMKTLYTLASGSYANVSEYLKGCIIVIDPCQNPDGHELYTNRYRSSMNLVINPDVNSWEHTRDGQVPDQTITCLILTATGHGRRRLKLSSDLFCIISSCRRFMPIFTKWDLNQLSFLHLEPIPGT
jgi:hypothetical protein